MWAWVEMSPGVSTRSGASTVSSTRPAKVGPRPDVKDPVALEDDRAIAEQAVAAAVEGDHVTGADQDAARRGHDRSPSAEEPELAPLGTTDPGDGVEVGGAQEAEQRVGDRPELLRHVVVVVGRRGRLAGGLGPRRGHDVGDDAPRPAGLLARGLDVRRRRLRVGLERLPDRLPVGELVVEAAGPQVGDEVADEVVDRLVVEHELEELALEPPGHRAPVAPDRLEPDELERLAARADDQARVALLAARRAAAHLGHQEARVDLLELELELARDAELGPQRRGDVGADGLAQALGPLRPPGPDRARRRRRRASPCRRR